MPPLHVPWHMNAGVMERAITETRRREPLPGQDPVPLWCPWPLPTGWTVTGVGWAGDDREGVSATVLATTGPAPLHDGPADVLLVAEQPGVGLASRYAGFSDRDPGPLLASATANQPAHAKVRVDGHPVPLWSVPGNPECSAYVGEARGIWLVAVAWPEDAGYLLAEELSFTDLGEWLPGELVYGAPSARLHDGPPAGR